MKLIFYLLIFFILSSCSFDNKTGIWKTETAISKKDIDVFKDFKTISTTEETFNQIIDLKKNNQISISKPKNNVVWNDIFFSDENNLENFRYNNLNQIIFKSKKLSNGKIDDYLLFQNGNLIASDKKGDIIVFSIKEKKIINKFNFYKKKYKRYKKKLNIFIEDNIIYVSDNIGYLYAFDYQQDKVLWAVNYQIPFKSNLKIINDKIISSDTNNNLIFFDKNNGELLKLFPTENTTITNEFLNNIAKNNNNLIFLNSYGSLYSFNGLNMKLNWFINLNPSLNLNQSNLFYGSEVVSAGGKIIVSSNNKTYLIEEKTGSIIKKFNFSTIIKPIIYGNTAFLVTKNSLLLSINLANAEILFSKDVNFQVAKFLNSKKKTVNFKNMMLLNNEIFLFLKNSFVLQFKKDGQLQEIKKLPTKINTFPILIESSILYLNFKNRLIIVD